MTPLARRAQGPRLRFPAGPGPAVAAARRRVVRVPEPRWADPVTVPDAAALPELPRRAAMAIPEPRRAAVPEPLRLSIAAPVRRAPLDPVRTRAAGTAPEAVERVDRVLLRIGFAPGTSTTPAAPDPVAASMPRAVEPYGATDPLTPGVVQPDGSPGLTMPGMPHAVARRVRLRTDAFAPGPRAAAVPDPVRPLAATALSALPSMPPMPARAILPVTMDGPAAPRMPDPTPARPVPSQPIAPRTARPVPAADAGDADDTPDAAPAASASGGAVLLDGQLVGQWLWDRMARDAERPPAGLTGFDVRRAPAWSVG